MNIRAENNDIILEHVKCLSLDLTLDCGQAFRWVKNEDDSWSGVAFEKYLNIKKVNDTVILKNTTLLMNTITFGKATLILTGIMLKYVIN